MILGTEVLWFIGLIASFISIGFGVISYIKNMQANFVLCVLLSIVSLGIVIVCSTVLHQHLIQNTIDCQKLNSCVDGSLNKEIQFMQELKNNEKLIYEKVYSNNTK